VKTLLHQPTPKPLLPIFSYFSSSLSSAISRIVATSKSLPPPLIQTTLVPQIYSKLLLHLVHKLPLRKGCIIVGGFKESTESPLKIKIDSCRLEIFLALLEYLYADRVTVNLEIAMELFQTADLFGVVRLKLICSRYMRQKMTVENDAVIFLEADTFNAQFLLEQALLFLLSYFEGVCRTEAFEEVARSNVELVLIILQKREGGMQTKGGKNLERLCGGEGTLHTFC